MLKELKFPITSLGTPLVVIIVDKKLAALPIPLSLIYWIGKKQKIPVAWKVRRTSSTNWSFHLVEMSSPRAAITDGFADSQNPCRPILNTPPCLMQIPKIRKTLGRSLPPGGWRMRRFRIHHCAQVSYCRSKCQGRSKGDAGVQ